MAAKEGKAGPRYGLFLGCLIPNRYPGIERSVRTVIATLGRGESFADIPQATCCPVPGIFYSADKDTWLALAARNLCLAQDRRLELVTLCNGCFASLMKACEHLAEPKRMGEVNRVLRSVLMKYTGIPRLTVEGRRVLEPVRVRHLVDVLHKDVGTEVIKGAVVSPLEGLKVAVHYGCHYLRPTERGWAEDPNDPRMIDAIGVALGAASVPAAPQRAGRRAAPRQRSHFSDLANAISRDKYDSIESSGADCIVTPCPFCLMQLDTAQQGFEGRKIPVLYVTQLMALAMGSDCRSVGLQHHKVAADGLAYGAGGG